MTTMASQITNLTVVYSTVYPDADQRKHQSSASLAFVWGIHRDRWIPHAKGQLRRKCFHLMTSSWNRWQLSSTKFICKQNSSYKTVDLHALTIKYEYFTYFLAHATTWNSWWTSIYLCNIIGPHTNFNASKTMFQAVVGNTRSTRLGELW